VAEVAEARVLISRAHEGDDRDGQERQL
jgi:hypothetical protein